MIEAASKPNATVEDDDVFQYPPDIEEALKIFMGLSSSWETAIDPIGGQVMRIGLRSTEIAAEMQLQGIRKRNRTALYQDIRVMERAALKVFMGNQSAQSS
ncbi:DUF1799 domain-containing protein [Orrella marina]|uniref:Uncharacterized protein n=1 Tax=Orrella marina TaxID=2163011 RepID=A0A2R4XF16_9BURK|nr:DUF1799 domain-containing protein [Orrella marina]AWB32380.1 hypothetical protein DBV39_00150 [Orrella marina]